MGRGCTKIPFDLKDMDIQDAGLSNGLTAEIAVT